MSDLICPVCNNECSSMGHDACQRRRRAERSGERAKIVAWIAAVYGGDPLAQHLITDLERGEHLK